MLNNFEKKKTRISIDIITSIQVCFLRRMTIKIHIYYVYGMCCK